MAGDGGGRIPVAVVACPDYRQDNVRAALGRAVALIGELHASSPPARQSSSSQTSSRASPPGRRYALTLSWPASWSG
ncbi:MAG: hypothetical protein NQU46_08340 [Methanolinea sp.]|nr:hypothetical protein [Methanolinea sp.]